MVKSMCYVLDRLDKNFPAILLFAHNTVTVHFNFSAILPV